MRRIDNPRIPWREHVFIPLSDAALIAGVSVSRLYDFQKGGRLEFRRFGGRTQVVVASLIALIDDAPEWTPCNRTRAAISARQERKRQSWKTS